MKRNPTRREILKLGSYAGVVGLGSASDAAAKPALVNDAVRNRVSGEGRYMMPAHFGPVFTGKLEDTDYHDVTSIQISYRTDPAQLGRYLPEPFDLRDGGILTISYSMNRQVDWLAGDNYNIVSVSTPATFHGKADKLSGDYALVLWENQTEPILAGREQGIPKIYGDIEDHRICKGVWSTCLSHGGHKILDLRAEGLKPTSDIKHEGESTERAWLGWRYVADETRAEVLLSYGTVFPYSITIRESWSAKGSLEWFRSTRNENPTQAHIINALDSLPIRKIESCIIWNGSMVLHVPNVRRIS